jgi:beta-mannosidase
MKTVIKPYGFWEIKGFDPCETLSADQLYSFMNNGDSDDEWIKSSIPAQVHDILLNEGIIEDPSLLGKVQECKWVSEKDWIYKLNFGHTKTESETYLHFKGLDTLVDIYLNGKHLAYHNDMYLPLRLKVTEQLEEENTLVLHFHSPQAYIQSHPLPEEWSKKIKPNRIIRKNENDFTGYLGAKPYLTPIGIYDQVLLEVIDEIEILETDISSGLVDGYGTGKVKITVNGMGYKDGAVLNFQLQGPNGLAVAEESCIIDCDKRVKWNQVIELAVESPELWWPRGYGEQPLYEVSVCVLLHNEIKDQHKKLIGFRDIKMIKPFEFIINNRPFKLWGAQPAQIQGFTHCWNHEKSNKILNLVENCNMNAQRIWGGSDRYADDYYDEADRRGILIWQEFFHDYGMYPDNREYRELCRKEAEYQVKRLKHHPSLLLWCGGNECFMGAEYDFPGEKYIGIEILTPGR